MTPYVESWRKRNDCTQECRHIAQNEPAFFCLLLLLPVCSVCKNGISGDAADTLANIVLEHTTLSMFCDIPLTSLRENTIEELDLNKKGIGIPGAIVLSKLLLSNSSLKTAKYVCILSTRHTLATPCLCPFLGVSTRGHFSAYHVLQLELQRYWWLLRRE